MVQTASHQDYPPVLSDLLSRNQSWAESQKKENPALLEACAKGQSPKVLWIGCADSRVPESVACQAQPGEIFVTRNIANQFNPDDDNAISVLTYAVQALGVEHVVVVGHTSCGGVNAAIAGSEIPIPEVPASTALFRHLTPLTKLAFDVKKENPGLEGAELAAKVTEASVKRQMKNIIETDVIKGNWSGEVSPLSNKVMNKVTVHGWIYDIATGQIQVVS
ncbi:carbonic anhydrase [Violaceomyces palustris]|uniref:Carbonic anhydrase n=1 Tax=Violaceomyces palustris TaxID=1673888 RepID=A0ACD0NUD6_9BASI|nr:carbonic anhydrase [Violaceomyces palustris]